MAYTNEVVGQVTEVTGEATVIRADGTEEVITLGTEIYLGDVVETVGDGAVNIGFTDDSSFAISDNASVTIDEYVFDPVTESGDQDFSVARGVFMYTSGLIGRESPDSVEIDTPVGSIGIRGTVIGGKIVEEGQGESQITVLEGAIVVRNEAGEQILSNQFDTVKLTSAVVAPSAVVQMDASRVANDYGAVKNVSASLFTALEDQMQAEEGVSEGLDESSVDDSEAEAEAAAQDGENVEAGEAAAEGEGDAEAQADGEADAENEIELDADDAAGDGETNLMDDLRAEADAQAESFNQQVSKQIAQQSTTSSQTTAQISTTVAASQTEPTTTQTQTAINEPAPIINPILSPITSPTETLFLEVRSLDVFSQADPIASLERVESFIPDGVYGAKLVDLSVHGSLADSLISGNFTISGPYSDYLKVRGNPTDGFALHLKPAIKLYHKAPGDTTFEFSHEIDGDTGVTVAKDTSFNLADINLTVTTAEGSEYTANTSINAVTSFTDYMTGTIAANEDIILGDNDDNSLGFTHNHDFKLIDGGEGIDTINLGGSSATMFDFTNDSSRSNLGANNSQDLRSIEIIEFTNSTDTLTIDIDNILRLLRTSDLTQTINGLIEPQRVLKIETHLDDPFGDADHINRIDLVDRENNDTDLISEGFTHLGRQFSGTTNYEVYQHNLGVVMIESNIGGSDTGGL